MIRKKGGQCFYSVCLSHPRITHTDSTHYTIFPSSEKYVHRQKYLYLILSECCFATKIASGSADVILVKM